MAGLLYALLTATLLDVSFCQLGAANDQPADAPLLSPTSVFFETVNPQTATPLVTGFLGNEYTGGVYDTPLTNLTLPGFQTRTEIMPVFPGRYFETQGSAGRRRLAQAPIKGQGGWTMFSLDAGVTVTHAVPIPNGQIFAYERSGNREANPLLASVYNLNTNTYRQFALQDSAFCGGHIMLKTGEVLIAGGDVSYQELDIGFRDGRFAVRIFTPGANPVIRQVATMKPGPHYPNYPAKIDGNSGGRWYPSMLTQPDGAVLITGGVTRSAANFFATNPTGQIYDPTTNVLKDPWPMPILQDVNNPFSLYPFTLLLPNNLVMVIAGRITRFYRITAAGQITQVEDYKKIPDLPYQVCYPQTASIHMLPIAPPKYAAKILVIGGASIDGARPATPASRYIFTLDMSLANPVWVRDTMSTPRIMPDGVLLPDGTVGIFNGAEVGVAGGTPGRGMATSPRATTQRVEIYNPNAPAGARFSGLLASAGRERFYHSQAWLTQNAEVLTAGSEPTEDYTIQIYTPPYLTGKFNRPIIAAPSSNSPAYNAPLKVALNWVPNNNGRETVTRVVFMLANGVTHSTHFDERSVVAAFTQTPNSLTVTTPHDNHVAPPGNYMLFAISSSGRPSQGLYIGLGGAKPAPKYFEPANRNILPDGRYTIQSTAPQLAACKFFGVPPCTGNTLAVTGGGADIWQLTSVRTAPELNTYNFNNVKRVGCQAVLASRRCQEGPSLGVYTADDRSGRQRFTLVPAKGGGYLIRVPYGRNQCQAVNYVTGGVCGKNEMVLAPLGAGPQVWNFVPVQTGPQQFANGLYTINNAGRTACASSLSLPPCAGSNEVYMGAQGTYQLTYQPATGTYTLFNQARTQCKGVLSAYRCETSNIAFAYTGDDNTGRQRFQFVKVNGGYNIVLPKGREGCTQPNFMTSQSCASGNVGVTFAPAGGGLQVWTITPLVGRALVANTPLLLASQLPPALQNGDYNIALSTRTQCDPYLNAAVCGASNNLTTASRSSWRLTALPSAPNPHTYQVQSLTRAGYCSDLMSASICSQGRGLTTAAQDDTTGRQQFQFIPTPGGYSIVLPAGRAGCPGSYVTGATCQAGSNVSLAAQGTGPQVWNVTPVPATPLINTTVSPPFPSGYYQIASVARSPCMFTRLLTSAACENGNAVNLGNTDTYYLSYNAGGTFPGTYTVVETGRTGSCSNILTAGLCPSSRLSHTDEDSEAGLTRFVFKQQKDGSYTIQTAVQSRPSCGSFLGSTKCGNYGVSLVDSDTGSGFEHWNVTTYTPPQLLPNGQYQLSSNGRGGCPGKQYLFAPQCAAGKALTIDSGGVFGLTYLTNAQYPNTYVMKVPDHTACGSVVSGNVCGDGTSVTTSAKDDGSGLQQFRFTPVAGGYQIDLPNGRPGCSSMLTASACSAAGASLTPTSQGALSVWSPRRQATITAPSTQLFANGDYHITNIGGMGCPNFLSGAACVNGDVVELAGADNGTGQVWTLQAVTSADVPNTYTVQCKYRNTCDSYLSAPSCSYSGVDFAPMDMSTGVQRWTISLSSSGYTIQVLQGRPTCPVQSFLWSAGCDAEPNGVWMGANTTTSEWNIVAVNPAAG